jgi:hypothetical protein
LETLELSDKEPAAMLEPGIVQRVGCQRLLLRNHQFPEPEESTALMGTGPKASLQSSDDFVQFVKVATKRHLDSL